MLREPDQVTAQSPPSQATVKLLLNDSISAIKSGDTNKALAHMNAVNQELAVVGRNSTSIQTLKLIVGDAIQLLQSRDTSQALIHLNQVYQQLSTLSASAQGNETNFLTYTNPILGVTMQYPHSWLIREYPNNPAANNTIVTFFSPSKSATSLGNISGVSGNFVPYVDIFIFSSKNMSLAEIVNGTIKELSGKTVIELKPSTLKSGGSAYTLVYTLKVATDELFKKMQLWTINDNKVYVTTFTAQAGLYPSYLSTAQKMLDSFEIATKPKG
jgi:hypothetical protein